MNLLERPVPRPWLAKWPPVADDTGANPEDWFDLADWIGKDRPSRRDDVLKIEGLLANSGDLSFERTQGPTGYWGIAQDDALRAFQRRNELDVDGLLRPGGPTIQKLRDQLAGTMAGYRPPTPDETEAHHRRVGDTDPGLIAWAQPGPDAPARQPPGTLLAAAPAILAVPPIVEALGAAATGLGLGAVTYDGIQKLQNGLGKDAGTGTPPSPPAPLPSLPGLVPPDPGEPPHTGNDAPAPDRITALQNIPVLPHEKREEIADQIGALVVEIQYEDGTKDNRGTDATVTGNNIVAQECKAAVSASRLADILVHKGGASLDGKGVIYKKELEVENEDGTKRRPDFSIGPKENKEPKDFAHINTVTTRADGTPSGRELEAYRDIARTLTNGIVKMVPKLDPDGDPEEYRLNVSAACKELVREYEEKLLGPESAEK